MICTNSAFDSSEGQQYTTKIVDKYVSSGRSTFYYFKLAPWGPQQSIEKVSVSKTLYEQKDIGENTQVLLNEGAHAIPYFDVMK
jgi:hypothetical protein